MTEIVLPVSGDFAKLERVKFSDLVVLAKFVNDELEPAGLAKGVA